MSHAQTGKDRSVHKRQPSAEYSPDSKRRKQKSPPPKGFGRQQSDCLAYDSEDKIAEEQPVSRAAKEQAGDLAEAVMPLDGSESDFAGGGKPSLDSRRSKREILQSSEDEKCDHVAGEGNNGILKTVKESESDGMTKMEGSRDALKASVVPGGSQVATREGEPWDHEDESDLSDVPDEPPKPKRMSKNLRVPTSKPKGTARQPNKNMTPDEAEIKKLQSWLLKCGVRKIWAFELKKYDNDNKAKISHLRNMLADVGMTGRFSEAKAREIKERRELEADLEAVREMDKNWGIRGSRTSRSRSKRYSEGTRGSGSDASENYYAGRFGLPRW